MGVFDRFFRRKNEAAPAEAASGEVTAESEAAEPEAPAEQAPAAEAVEIPKQQSVEAAADSETGEGART